MYRWQIVPTMVLWPTDLYIYIDRQSSQSPINVGGVGSTNVPSGKRHFASRLPSSSTHSQVEPIGHRTVNRMQRPLGDSKIKTQGSNSVDRTPNITDTEKLTATSAVRTIRTKAIDVMTTPIKMSACH